MNNHIKFWLTFTILVFVFAPIHILLKYFKHFTGLGNSTSVIKLGSGISVTKETLYTVCVTVLASLSSKSLVENLPLQNFFKFIK